MGVRVIHANLLKKALPDRVFRQISLDDITPEVAKKFVLNHLDAEDDTPLPDTKELTTVQRAHQLENLDACIEVLGGRLTDLEFLARRLKTGQSPEKAVQEIIEQSASEVLKMFLITNNKQDDAKKWSKEQAWYLVKELASNESLRYNEVLLSNTFTSSLTPTASSGESVLEALSQAELISIKSHKGRPTSIKTGKPVYVAAFKMLAEDKVLRSRLDLALLGELSKIESKSIEKFENELVLLGNLPSQPGELRGRVGWLLGKVAASQTKVEKWEIEMATLKKALQEDE